MTRDEWLMLARQERESPARDARTLHLLNAMIEHANLTPESAVLWDEFDTFLLGSTSASASGALEKFIATQGVNSPPRQLMGPEVKPGPERLSTTANLPRAKKLVNGSRRYGDSLAPLFARIEDDIKEADYRNGLSSDNSLAPIDWVGELEDAIGAFSGTSVQLERVAQAVSTPPRRRASERSVVWLTKESDVRRTVNQGALNRKSLRVRSHLGSLRRYASGLFHHTDLKSIEIQRRLYPKLPAFRMVLELQVAGDDPFLHPVVQPTIFSEGDPALYVSAAHKPTSGGRTCRLERQKCRHVGNRCECAGVGLPEMLVSGATFASADSLAIRNPHFLLTRHLKKFGRPSVDLIHTKRGM